MMNPKLQGLLQSNLLLGASALTCGILAAWLGARHLSERASVLEHEAQRKYATAPFIVASRDVSKGQRIDASVLSVRAMPTAFAPADALAPSSADMLIGARAAIGIRRGSAVVPAAIAPESAGRLSEQLPDGMRAMTIQVDQLNALAGRLEAGDTVDLYYSRTQGSGAILRPLMQRVRVLATGSLTESDSPTQQGEVAGDFSSVTLLLSPQDAQRVVLAEQTGRLTLLLRRPADSSLLEARTFDSTDLLRTARASGSRQRQGLAVELLTGGTGGAPLRSWLSPGEGA